MSEELFPIMRGDKASGGRRWRYLDLGAGGVAVVEKAYLVHDVKLTLAERRHKGAQQLMVAMRPAEARVVARRLLQLADAVDREKRGNP